MGRKKANIIEAPIAPIEMRRIPFAQINRAPYNPRVSLKTENPEKYRLLKASILEFSCVELLIWNEQTGNLVGGHQRLDVLKELGATEVDVSVVNLSLSKEKALNLSLNQNTGDWDLSKLDALLQEINTGEFDMDITGFTEQAMADIRKQFQTGEVKDEGKEEKIPSQFIVIVDCESEAMQVEVLEYLQQRDYSCRALVS